MWAPLASASLVFLILYLFIFLFLAYLYVLRKVPLWSRWLVLLLHVTVRLAAQASGVSFGIVGYGNFNLLIAYYILGAEGYFTLVICTARYLIAWQREHWGGYSWLEPVDPTKERGGWRKRFGRMFQWKKSTQSTSASAVLVVDWILAAANAIIVAGGSLTGAAYRDKSLTPIEVENRLHSARAMRAAGQAIFLAINMALLGCVATTIHQHRTRRFSNSPINAESSSTVEAQSSPPAEAQSQTPMPEKSPEQPVARETYEDDSPRPWYGHPTLLLILTTWPLLAVRGGFGVAQSISPDLNFFNPEVYDANNLTAQFVVEETCFVTMMECLSAALLAATYCTSRPKWSRTNQA